MESTYNSVFASTVAVTVIAILIGAAVACLAGKSPKYDERQARARGNAYKAAFWTAVSFYLLNALFETWTGERWGDPITEGFMGVCVSVMVFAVICIFTDAYFALNEKRVKMVITFGVIALVNAAIVLVNIASGFPFITDGLLNFRTMNIVVLVMFAVMFAALLIKLFIDRRAERE